MVVVAGMEGALPSVVGGYVACPVIAVPTSVGYGASFGGIAALLGMLNSCASNVTVVNIDAGFKGGYVAGLIAKNVARGRAGQGQRKGKTFALKIGHCKFVIADPLIVPSMSSHQKTCFLGFRLGGRTPTRAISARP